jgi:hypothetical protein
VLQVTSPPVAPPADDGGSLHSRVRKGRVGGAGAIFAACLVLTFVNFAAWSLATPLFASPDESTQVVAAAAAVRGEVVGFTIDGPRSAFTAVHVPEVFASGTTYPVCFKYHPTVPASCAPHLSTSAKTVHIGTYVGRYPPLYYLITGLPSLLFVSKTGIYLMRVMSSLLNAVLIALALLAVVRWSRRKLLLVGVMAAATPMAWFLGGMVNPSGFEICSAICLWTAGLVLVLEHPDRPPPGLVAVVALSAGLLSLARPISPVWVVLTSIALGILGGRRALLGLLGSRAARWSALPLAACGAFALWWISAEHALDLVPGFPVPSGESRLQLLGTVLAHDGVRVQQMVGVFGWNDTASPLLTYVAWLVIVGLLLVLAVWRAGAWRAGTLLSLLAAVVVVPLVLAYAEALRAGFVDGQGRYWLPLAVGVPLVSAALVERRTVPAWLFPRVVPVVAVGLGAASIAAFLWALRRYAVGVTGPVDFLVGKWAPPVGLLGAAVGGCACIALLLTAVVVETRRPNMVELLAPTAGSVRPASREAQPGRARLGPATASEVPADSQRANRVAVERRPALRAGSAPRS